MRNKRSKFIRTREEWSLENFNNGYIDADGRFRVFLPKHHRASAQNGYVLRSIVAYEKYHNVSVPFSQNHFEIHHIDGNRLNDSKENLLLLSNSEHQKAHARMNGQILEMTCENCNKLFEINAWRLRERDSNRGRFCSPNCCYEYKKERGLSVGHRRNISLGLKKAYKEGKR